MDTNAILKRADELFDDDRAQEAGAYLEKMAEQAVSEERYGTAMSLFNELTGYYRNTGNLDAAWRCVDEIVRLIDLLDLWGTADAAYTRPPGTQPPRSRYTKSASRCSSPKMSATGVWQGYTTTSA